MSGLIFLFIAALAAFALSALCGGGAGMMLIPLLNALLPLTGVPAALTLGTFFSAASRLYVFRKHVRLKIVSRFVPAALPAVVLGAWMLRFLNPVYLGLLMGIFLVSNLPMLLRKSKLPPDEKQPGGLALAGVGMAAGFLSGLTGAVGLLFNRFYFRCGLSPKEIVATRAANEILLHLLKLALYLFLGLMDNKTLPAGCIVALAGILSSLLLQRGLSRISGSLFRRIGYLAMVASGFVMLYQSGDSLFRAHNAYISFRPVNKGTEATLQWQQSRIAMEWSWDEGPEYEREVPFAALSARQQQYVLGLAGNADKIIVEAVYAWREKSFEAYCFREGKLQRKISFR